jgi:hypothetical protein
MPKSAFPTSRIGAKGAVSSLALTGSGGQA